ncbi:helix-turn-helix domain-containing protein [Anaerospora hongkongensis]|uniref:helix-turn-helix domain-containing protein n=1 Tax=Anaerospora hongkongensis TaxID=244830 RepID=UPI00289EBE26|nr:helix-turn-helix domain-containing protein [Anaerospora hongkongensis]
MDKPYTTKQVAEMLQVTVNTVKLWLKDGKLRGEKLGKSWRITKKNLEEAFPEMDFSFSEFFSEEEMDKKLASQIPNQDKALKEIYPKEYEKHHEHEASCRSADTALTRYYNQCQIFLERRFPYIPSKKAEDNPLLDIWSFYEMKYKEELMKLEKLTSKIKEKHGVPEEDLAEVKRTYENIELLKVGILSSDVSHL